MELSQALGIINLTAHRKCKALLTSFPLTSLSRHFLSLIP